MNDKTGILYCRVVPFADSQGMGFAARKLMVVTGSKVPVLLKYRNSTTACLSKADSGENPAGTLDHL